MEPHGDGGGIDPLRPEIAVNRGDTDSGQDRRSVLLVIDERTLAVQGVLTLHQRPGSARTAPSPTDSSPPLADLSPREMDVLRELAHGGSTKEIAESMHLSCGTVKGYLSSIMAKWNARDRVQVLVLAFTFGVIRIDAPHEAFSRERLR